MNKKGFTLVELIAVIVLLALVMMLIVPSLNTLRSSNSKKEYETYMDMMVEYTKVYPNYKNKSHICLSELKNEVNMKDLSDHVSCDGYVIINGTRLEPFLYCTKSAEEVYKSDNYLSTKCS